MYLSITTIKIIHRLTSPKCMIFLNKLFLQIKSVRLIFYKWNEVKNLSRTDPESEANRDPRINTIYSENI